MAEVHMIGQRKAFWLTVLMVLPWAARPATPLSDLSDEIRAASAKLLDPSGNHADGLSAVRTLVDILARMAQADTRVPETARARLGEASNAFRTGASIDGKGVRLLNEAWKSISGGTAFVFPAGVKDIPTASAQVKTRVDACLASLANGRGDRAVRELLEAVLMTVTPMEARGSLGIPTIGRLWILFILASQAAGVSPGPQVTDVAVGAGTVARVGPTRL
jgi:hypothetical protein